jgi:hypothetical protein
VFVFLGQLQPAEAAEVIDYDVILEDFDRLLPLYEFVENTPSFPTLAPAGSGFHFEAGCRAGRGRTTANLAAQQLDVDLRNNLLRKAVYRALSRRFGAKAVGTERPNEIGGLSMLWSGKAGVTGSTRSRRPCPRACIREGLAQLLEYAYWPGHKRRDASLTWASLKRIRLCRQQKAVPGGCRRNKEGDPLRNCRRVPGAVRPTS